MIRKLHIHHITVPVFLLFCGALIGIIWGYQLQSSLLLNLSVIAIFLYMIFAFTHHHFDRTFNLEVMLEYILMATLVLILIVGTMFY